MTRKRPTIRTDKISVKCTVCGSLKTDGKAEGQMYVEDGQHKFRQVVKAHCIECGNKFTVVDQWDVEVFDDL